MPSSRLSNLAALRGNNNARNAKRLRTNMTDAERRLWYHVRGGRFRGYRFRRQVPLGDYIVDFLCEKAKLVVEIDGSQHMSGPQAAYDGRRSEWLRGHGYRVIRFWSDAVLLETSGVLEAMLAALEGNANSL